MFSSSGNDVLAGFDAGGRLALEASPIDAFMEHDMVRDGISLFRAGGRATPGFSFQAHGHIPANNLILGCVLRGSGVLEAEGNADQRWREPGQAYAVSLSSRPVRYDIDAQQDFASVAVMLTPTALEGLAGNDAVPPMFERAILKDREKLSSFRTADPQVRRVAQELFNPAFRGRMARLYRESKVLELLALHLSLFGADEPRRQALTSLEVLKVREAHEVLLADLGAPPDLHGLAAAVGLRSKRLNEGFRLLYGTTVFDYLLDARMEAARRALDEGLNAPLKQLAWQLGYRQLPNFINAFRRRYGVAPGAYRRKSG